MFRVASDLKRIRVRWTPQNALIYMNEEIKELRNVLKGESI